MNTAALEQVLVLEAMRERLESEQYYEAEPEHSAEAKYEEDLGTSYIDPYTGQTVLVLRRLNTLNHLHN